MRSVYALLAFSLCALTSLAANTRVSRDLIIPVIGRANGAFESQWRTDVFITNLATSGAPAEVGVMLTGSTSKATTLHVAPGQTVVTKDAFKAWSGSEQGLASLRITVADGNARIIAHARIYNSNARGGRFGQLVHAIPVLSLGDTAIIAGVSGGANARTNFGVAFADDHADVTIELLDEQGGVRASRSHFFAYGELQINDLYSYFPVPPSEGDSLRVTSTVPIVAYASIAQNDSGDADFVMSAALDVATDEFVEPQCANPAPLYLALFPQAGYRVGATPPTNLHGLLADLQPKYGFELVSPPHPTSSSFLARLTPAMIAGIRCEEGVSKVEQNETAFELSR